MTIGERVKKIRIERGLTQDELAQLVGYKSRSSINKIELNKQEMVQSSIAAFSRALKVSPLVLLGIEDEIEKSLPLDDTEKQALYKNIALLDDFELNELRKYINNLLSKYEEQQG